VRSKISLCLIARDEEEMLPGCLASVKDVVDEIVLVDTGSRDRTREIASASDARVLDLPWEDDFSAPRNAAIRAARGDWLLQLDADERLAPGAGTALRQAVKGRFDLGHLPLHNSSSIEAPAADVVAGRARLGNPTWLPRLVRNSGEPRYTGIVHESVYAWARSVGCREAHVEAPIVHLGGIPALRKDRNKDERNLALLRKQCACSPDDVTALSYLAGELFRRGDLAGAADALDRGWAARDRLPSWCSFLRLAVQRARLAIRRGDPHLALETLDRVERREGSSFDAALMRARAWDLASYQRGDPAARAAAATEAAAAYVRALSLHGATEYQKLNTAGPAELHLARGHALLVAGRIGEAEAEFDHLLAIHPSSTHALLGRAEVAVRRGDGVVALRILEPLLASGLAVLDTWLLASEAARVMGAARDRLTFLQRALAGSAAGALAAHRQVLLRDAMCAVQVEARRDA
jgi:tetratricopeptide (TPR) repeat protein